MKRSRLKPRRALRNDEQTREEVIEMLKEIAFFDLGDCIDDDGQLLHITELPQRARRVLEAFGPQGVKIPNRLKALEMLGKHYGLLNERAHVQVAVEKPALPEKPVDFSGLSSAEKKVLAKLVGIDYVAAEDLCALPSDNLDE